MKLNPIFTSHMVFAANLPIRIYGEGKGNVEITFAGKSKCLVSENDNWIIEFQSMQYGGPYTMKIIFDDGTVILDDIYVGKVFLCAGQSNMQFKLKEAKYPKSILKANDKLRMFATKHMEAEKFSPKDGWVIADAESVFDWSAIGYFVGEQISQTEDIAVGIIGCYQGASMIESWVPKGTYQKAGIAVPDDKKHGDFSYELFKKWNCDAALYDFTFSQVIPFSVSAVLWYQGESNSNTEGGRVYAQMLEIMINTWREDLKNEKLPFVIVQIADNIPRLSEGWRLVQKAQLDIQKMTDNVKTVISADVCETDDIHPPTKHLLAERIVGALDELLN